MVQRARVWGGVAVLQRSGGEVRWWLARTTRHYVLLCVTVASESQTLRCHRSPWSIAREVARVAVNAEGPGPTTTSLCS